MNVSIIIPVLNETIFLAKAIDCLLRQQYTKGEYEIIVVDDGSKQPTKDILQHYAALNEIRLVEHPERMGRLQARLSGARSAQYERLVFVDARVSVSSNFLEELVDDHACAIPGEIRRDDNHWIERFFYLVRYFFFRDYYDNHHGRPYCITLDNFDKTPKGATALSIQRGIFLGELASLGNIDQYASDDIKLFRAVLNSGEPIYRNPNVEIEYGQRQGFRENFWHLKERGPRFVDYYFGSNVKITILITLILMLLLFAMISPLMPIEIFLGYWVLVSVIVIGTGLMLSRSIRDFIIVTLLFPLFMIPVSIGLLEGIILSTRRKILCVLKKS